MAIKTDIKYNNVIIDSLTSTGAVRYDTKNKYLEQDLKIEFTGPDDATATANKILNGYTAYIADGSKATGTIPTKAAATYTASTNDQTISLAQYLAGDQTIKAVSLNATASNMLSGTSVSIESNGSTVTSIGGSIQTWNGEKFNPLCFTANTSSASVSLRVAGTPVGTDFKTSTDGVTWTTCVPGRTVIDLNAGDKVYFKGNNPNGVSLDFANYYYFSIMRGTVSASGNIMSLIDDGDGTATTIPNAFCFEKLFEHCALLTHAPELPAIVLTEGCYSDMFYYCTGLTTAPELPATTLARACYRYMFWNCTALTTPPELPVTALAEYCYYNMFYNCTSLTTAPALPATRAVQGCYHSMFSGCTSLTAAPSLPATTLAVACYNDMFQGCTSLVIVPALPATVFEMICYSSMFEGCTSLVVSDTSEERADKVWVIPQSGLGSGDYTHSDMFKNCLGGRMASEESPNFNNTQITYYTQNIPV